MPLDESEWTLVRQLVLDHLVATSNPYPVLQMYFPDDVANWRVTQTARENADMLVSQAKRASLAEPAPFSIRLLETLRRLPPIEVLPVSHTVTSYLKRLLAEKADFDRNDLDRERRVASAPLPPIRIVISYRRQDTTGDAHRLRDSLSRQFGRENVFLDIDSIPPGTDWRESITETVSTSDVLLLLIGLHWLTVTNETGGRRLDDTNDVLRFEIELALKSRLRMIPIQLNGAAMPSSKELPESLNGLTRHQSIRIDADRWRFDVQRLTRELKAIRKAKAESGSRSAD